MFGGLFAFGFLNAVLGPALPYLRSVEHISYLVGALHQAAYAIGGGVAGLLAARELRSISRSAVIGAGLVAAGLAGLGVGYGALPAVTIAAALMMSLLGTSALIALWAVLADLHGSWRPVAMTEGEVSVSLAGIVTPLLIGALATTVLSWRFAFVLGVGTTVVAAVWVWRARLPAAAERHVQGPSPDAVATHRWLQPTLIVIVAIVALEFSLSFWLASYLNDDIGLARTSAAAAVSGLYASSLAGRLLASRLARRVSAEALLVGSLATALAASPILLTATGGGVAAVGIALAGLGVGATFPLTSALHISASPRSADSALGQVLGVASIGQIVGPLTVGAIAQVAGLRAGLLILPVLTLIAAAGLYRFCAGAQTAGAASTPRRQCAAR
ncbi:MAG TPA: MFS transporter [Solirubrobacteraceae bacterium]|nr:MFS transporter [Solirubrobacteraceae bacterium]